MKIYRRNEQSIEKFRTLRLTPFNNQNSENNETHEKNVSSGNNEIRGNNVNSAKLINCYVPAYYSD
jgi:hypothetical protein